MRLLTWAFFATLSAILFLQLRGLDEPLHTVDTPGGIVAYELAGSSTQAQHIIEAWRSADVIEAAKVSLGVDFVFLLAYPAFFFTSIGLLRREDGSRLDRLGAWLRPAVLACIALDATENVLLWRMLDTGASTMLTPLATLCAAIKFALVIAAAVWCLVMLSQRLTARRRA